MWTTPALSQLEAAISSPQNPIGMRMRAAYFLRQEYENYVKNNDDSEGEICKNVIDFLGIGLQNKEHGSLMRHEFAYVLGQLRDERACPVLEKILSDKTDNTMVRHECAEALGAIGALSSLPILQSIQQQSKSTQNEEISQTCEIAIDYMTWKNSSKSKEEEEYDGVACACMLSPYSSHDPAPPHPTHVHLSTEELGDILRREEKPLFERYRAMFSLRNRGTTECVHELGNTLVQDSSSALLRHEIAYVLGQMAHDASVESLSESLRRKGEHEMVRHESAEALGAIEGRWEDVEKILREFSDDEDVVVKESCLVALDAADYWGYGGAHEEEEEEKKQVDDGENNNAEDGPLSFVQQKAVTNGKRMEDGEKKDVIRNHFNVVV
mmetsp:Transcript_24246/g.36171  ORF Transcript_24246/g.36171 Transcript_24246/m.36171 type:complete len:382 (-) Transcript_24246:122-1267(-)